MTAEQHKALLLKFTDAMNQPDWETALDKFVELGDLAEFKASHAEFRKAFPDYHASIVAILGEGDGVAVLQKVSGTHSAEFPYADLKGIPATGTHLEWLEANFVTFKDGKIVDAVLIVDNYSRLVQLGVYS